MPRTAARYYLILGSFDSFDTAEAAAKAIADETGNASDMCLVKGEEVPFTVHREPSVVFGTPAKKAKKPRAKTVTGRIPSVQELASAPKRGGRPKGSKNRPKVPINPGSPALANGTPVQLD
jgi:hypothetical protein